MKRIEIGFKNGKPSYRIEVEGTTEEECDKKLDDMRYSATRFTILKSIFSLFTKRIDKFFE